MRTFVEIITSFALPSARAQEANTVHFNEENMGPQQAQALKNAFITLLVGVSLIDDQPGYHGEFTGGFKPGPVGLGISTHYTQGKLH